MGLFKGTSRKETLRTEAAMKGFTVTDVERLLPTVSAGGGNVDSLDKDTCARYALKRTGTTGASWSLLMRDKKHGAQLPNGFLIEGANVTPELLAALTPLAEEFCEGYFEFEGTPTEVAVFWDEDGDKDVIESFYDALDALRSSF